jgi:hypothetical protein
MTDGLGPSKDGLEDDGDMGSSSVDAMDLESRLRTKLLREGSASRVRGLVSGVGSKDWLTGLACEGFGARGVGRVLTESISDGRAVGGGDGVVIVPVETIMGF